MASIVANLWTETITRLTAIRVATSDPGRWIPPGRRICEKCPIEVCLVAIFSHCSSSLPPFVRGVPRYGEPCPQTVSRTCRSTPARAGRRSTIRSCVSRRPTCTCSVPGTCWDLRRGGARQTRRCAAGLLPALSDRRTRAPTGDGIPHPRAGGRHDLAAAPHGADRGGGAHVVRSSKR